MCCNSAVLCHTRWNIGGDKLGTSCNKKGNLYGCTRSPFGTQLALKEIKRILGQPVMSVTRFVTSISKGDRC